MLELHNIRFEYLNFGSRDELNYTKEFRKDVRTTWTNFQTIFLCTSQIDETRRYFNGFSEVNFLVLTFALLSGKHYYCDGTWIRYLSIVRNLKSKKQIKICFIYNLICRSNVNECHICYCFHLLWDFSALFVSGGGYISSWIVEVIQWKWKRII